MFKDVFVLKKSAWHVKMMKYMWNLDYRDFSHMCPYWWLSVLNHLIFIPWFIVKETIKLLGKLIVLIGKGLEAFFDWYQEVSEEQQRRKYERILSDKEYAKGLLRNDKTRQKIYRKAVMIGGSLRNMFYEIDNEIDEEDRQLREQEEKKRKERLQRSITGEGTTFGMFTVGEKAPIEDDYNPSSYDADLKRQQAEAERRRRNKEKINKIIRITKPILTTGAYTLGSIVVAIGVFYFGKLMIFLYQAFKSVKHSTWVEFGHGTLIVFEWLLITAVAILLIVILVKMCKNIRFPRILSPKAKTLIGKILMTTFKGIAYPFIKVGKFFAWLGKGIASIFGLMIQMFKNNCPAIEWKD